MLQTQKWQKVKFDIILRTNSTFSIKTLRGNAFYGY